MGDDELLNHLGLNEELLMTFPESGMLVSGEGLRDAGRLARTCCGSGLDMV
jgi:hypothetical protein